MRREWGVRFRNGVVAEGFDEADVRNRVRVERAKGGSREIVAVYRDVSDWAVSPDVARKPHDSRNQEENIMTGIEDTTNGQCSGALTIKGEFFRCDLAVEHAGWAHSSKDAEAIWADRGADPEPSDSREER